MSLSHAIARMLVSAAVLAAVGAHAASPEDRSFTFEIETPALEAVAREDGRAELRLAGFETHPAVIGAPDVPVRTELVALPPDCTPRLSVRLTGRRGFRAVVPRPAPRHGWLAGAEGARDELRAFEDRSSHTFFEPSAEHYEGAGTLPERVAWLGRTGVLRDQRYVEVHLAPVRFDRERQGLVIDSRLEVTVDFEGGRASSPMAAPTDRFESVYRTAFRNYTQGRRFRLGALSARSAPGADESRAATRSSGPIRRVVVRENGIVRLDHALLASRAPEFLAVDPAFWRLVNRGEQLPLHVEQGPGDDSVLEPGEWVQFYGQAMDGEPETVINHEKPSNPSENLYAVSDFTDANPYFLTLEPGAQPAMAEREAAAPPSGSPVADFEAVARVELDDQYLPLAEEVWFWSPFTNESSGPRAEAVALPGLAAGSSPAEVRVRLRGFIDCPETDPDHETVVYLENDLGETLVLPADDPNNAGDENVGLHDGNEIFVHEFAWTHAGGDPVLTDPVHVVLDAPDIAGSCPTDGIPYLNENLLDSIEVVYRRAFRAENDALTFEVPDGDAWFRIEGFASDAVDVYETTARAGTSDVVAPVRLTGVAVDQEGMSYTVRFRMDDDPGLDPDTPRQFVVVGRAGVPAPAPADFVADRVSTLASDPTQADLVVIAHPELVLSRCSEGGNACLHDVDCVAGPTDRCEIESGSRLDELLTLRAMGGISSRVARIQDIEDEFNHGLPGPEAIRAFLAWVWSGGWDGPPPAFVMLLGDGSYDYKGGTASGNYVPTQMMVKQSDLLAIYASDNLLAAVAGDDHLAEMVVGRITARDESSASAVLAKILDYQEQPSGGAWRSSTLLVSDRGKNYKHNEAMSFEGMNNLAASYLSGSNYTSTKLRYWSDNCGWVPANCDPGFMKQEIKDHVSGFQGDGAAVAQFVGHGNFDLWSDDVFFCVNEENDHERCSFDDTTDLTNGARLPFLMVHNCLTGGFHAAGQKTFGEQWLKWGGGGAVAVYAPSGLGYRFIGNAVISVIWNDLFGPAKERMLAAPVMHSQVQLCSQGSIEACQYYTLLGDPSLRLGLPHVGPPTNVEAEASTGAEAFVELSWEASSTPGASYDVYRTRQLNLAYAKVNSSPLTGTTYLDAAVEPTQTYYYYVLATEGGFESAWSNFNRDCGETPGPDCLQARPLNLVPPATPTGVSVTDAETGGRLDVAWDPNPEPDLATYTVHFGSSPAMGETKTINGVAETSLSGLENGTTYYVSVLARNTSGTSSALSDPAVEGVPHLVLGVKPPELISDLRLAKSGSDAVLGWGAVTHDVYGLPVNVVRYDVFRGEAATFLPELGTPYATTTVPGFDDVGALAGGGDYFYLVRAVDQGGIGGGLGRQLPQGILDLVLEPSPSTPGANFLSWSPVTADLAGNPTTISHYEIYGADEPFTRADIEHGGVTLVVPIASTTTAEILPVGPKRYYSVLAVDARGNRSPF